MMTGNELKVLEAIPPGGCSLAAIHRRAGLSRATASRILTHLEERGLVERTPNAWGPETPFWFERIPAAPEGFDPATVTVERDAIYDRGQTTDRTWLLLTGEVNEHGCAVAWLHAGEHNARKTYVPLHALASEYRRRRRGPVTEWSARFSCPNHGECTDEMVTTAKTCSLCGALLNRH